MIPVPSADRDFVPLLVELLTYASIEIAAGGTKAIANVHEHFDPGADVYVTFLPGGDYQAVVDTAVRLRRAGYRPVPHIAARALPDNAALDNFVSRLVGEAGVDRVLVIAGDSNAPSGPFSSAMVVLRSGILKRHGVRSVGFAGHPEGHPVVDRAILDAALAAKIASARNAGLDAFVVTQFGFAAAPVLAWLRRFRDQGLDVPVEVGIAGPATMATLVKFGLRCGIGNSLRALRMRPNTVGRLLGEVGPEELLRDLAMGLVSFPAHGVSRIHFFPFGGIARTGEFLAGTLSRLYGEISPAAPAS
ncbi:MAG TPA: methylenetetrahydrofolate reductase [Pseudolabrys sp.]|nr:methylenetetrahydrofolate reductase [Pseudolabrys sp.]